MPSRVRSEMRAPRFKDRFKADPLLIPVASLLGEEDAAVNEEVEKFEKFEEELRLRPGRVSCGLRGPLTQIPPPRKLLEAGDDDAIVKA